MHFVVDVLTIIGIDLVLSGDNGVVIALAVNTLPTRMRRRAIVAGSACAAMFQVLATLLAMELLRVPFLQLIGGLLILWISINLFRHSTSGDDPAEERSELWKAIVFIVVANFTMSTDNVLAVAAAAHGNGWLMALGLAVSVPMVIFASGFLAGIMDRYPVVVYAGAALLGKISGQMIMTDSATMSLLHPSAFAIYCAEAAAAMGVLAAGRVLVERRRRSDATDVEVVGASQS
jgi:YjbE family integral membrane protein